MSERLPSRDIISIVSSCLNIAWAVVLIVLSFTGDGYGVIAALVAGLAGSPFVICAFVVSFVLRDADASSRFAVGSVVAVVVTLLCFAVRMLG